MRLTDIARQIVEEAQRYAGWGYGAGLSVAEQDAQRRIDCSSLTARILCAANDWPIGGRAYGALVLRTDTEDWERWGMESPIRILEAYRAGESADLADLRPGEAALVQTATHAYIVIGSDEPGRVYLLESTSHPATPTGTRAAGPSWREVDYVGQRWQWQLDRMGDAVTVPIASLGEHRAAVLYPRAQEATVHADVSVHLSSRAVRPPSPTPSPEATMSRTFLPDLEDLEDHVDVARDKLIAETIDAVADGRIDADEAKALLTSQIAALADALIELPSPAEEVSDMVIEQVAAPVAAQLYGWADSAWDAVRELFRADPGRLLEKAETLRERGTPAATKRAERKAERAREILGKRKSYLRSLDAIAARKALVEGQT